LEEVLEETLVSIPVPKTLNTPDGESNDQLDVNAQISAESEALDFERVQEVGGEVSDHDELPAPTRPIRTNRGIPATRYEEEFGRGIDRLGQRRHIAMVATTTATSLPQTYQEAIRSPQHIDWKAAIDQEMASIMENKTWKVVPNTGQKTIKCRWVFTRKSDGRFKARIVAKGFTQVYGVDYTETFAPVVKWATIRLLLLIAALFGLELVQMDVVTAFLNGDLDEIIFIDLPPGYEQAGMICQLLRSLYGLKQSPRQWYQKLHAFLISLGFRQSTADPCFYIRGTDPRKSCYIAVYVDDLAIAGPLDQVQQLQDYLSSTFKMKDMGDIKDFLGVTVERNREKGTISISNAAYLEKILEEYSMENCNPVATPAPPGQHLKALEKDDAGEYISIHQHAEYQSLVGSLLYASTPCRPDICNAVGALARHMHAPGMEHWAAAKHMLRYIQRTKHATLVLGHRDPEKPSESELKMELYSDSDYAGDKNTRKSTTGVVAMLYGSAISWQSKLQRTVAQSTMEAEYVAMAQAVKEALRFSKLMYDITGDGQLPIVIKSDNSAAQILAKNPENHERAKHIDTKYHLIRDEVERKRIALEYVESRHNVADLLTKFLPVQTHRYLTEKSGLII
jgi:hypothetical protein